MDKAIAGIVENQWVGLLCGDIGFTGSLHEYSILFVWFTGLAENKLLFADFICKCLFGTS